MSDNEQQKNTTGNRVRVFVYGTLKRGHGNHRLISDDKTSEFLGRSFIEGRYRMVDMGYFPGVMQSTIVAGSRIYGEVYSVSLETLFSLDLLEGHPDFYRRVKIWPNGTDSEGNEFKKAWCYFLPTNYAERPPVKDGIWRPSNEELEWVNSLQAAS